MRENFVTEGCKIRPVRHSPFITGSFRVVFNELVAILRSSLLARRHCWISDVTTSSKFERCNYPQHGSRGSLEEPKIATNIPQVSVGDDSQANWKHGGLGMVLLWI